MKKAIASLLLIISIFSVTVVASADNGPRWEPPADGTTTDGTTTDGTGGTITPLDNGPRW